MKLLKAVTLLTILMTSCVSNDSNTLDTNFVHVVYFWLHNPDNPEERKEFETKLNSFLDNSLYAKTKFVGVPAMTDREVVDNSYTYSLIVSFSSKEEHKKFRELP